MICPAYGKDSPDQAAGGTAGGAALVPAAKQPAARASGAPPAAQTAPGAIAAAQSAAAAAAAAAADKVKAASRDAWAAFKQFATDPVGGLPVACEGLGAKRALEVGIVFGMVCTAAAIFAAFRLLPWWCAPRGFSGFLKAGIYCAIPFAALAGTTFAVRKILRSFGNFGYDCFIAGAALLPLGFVMFAASVLGDTESRLVVILAVIGVCLAVLMLFAALTRTFKVSDRAATFLLPLMIIVTYWLSDLVYGAMNNIR